MAQRIRSTREKLEVEVGGAPYAGWLTINDVGGGKVMFEVEYGSAHHEDKSVFRRGDTQIEQWARNELTRLIQDSLNVKR